jgi:hypothetical protein
LAGQLSARRRTEKHAGLTAAVFLQTRFVECTGVSFIGATSIAVFHNRRIESNRFFRDAAKRGKTSVGWFCGFKVRLVITALIAYTYQEKKLSLNLGSY